jgi:putative oxidoreductase
MDRLISLHNAVFAAVERLGDLGLGLLMRLVFAATLLVYYWNSGLTKLGDGLFGFMTVTAGGFGQIFPKQAEAVLWDVTQMSLGQKLVVLAGTWAEFILPLLIVIGLLTRLAALGMIGFVVVQTWVDVTGHGAALGTLFDRSYGLIDERTIWVAGLLVLLVKGAGALSVDRSLGLAPVPRVTSA